MKLLAKNWATFQHYKHRSPPWIRLHRSLLDDYDFHRLPVASKALAPCLWLLASEEKEGEIEASTEEIAFRLRMTEKDLIAALKPLIEKGFFVDASNTLADCKQDATTETETETEKRQSQSQRQSRAIALPLDFVPNDGHKKLAEELRVTLNDELAKFSDYHVAKGTTMKNWDAALNTWLRNAVGFNRGKAVPKQNGYVHDLTKMDYTKGVDEDGNF
jgi:hypothetical protein